MGNLISTLRRTSARHGTNNNTVPVFVEVIYDASRYPGAALREIRKLKNNRHKHGKCR